jgi:hypothetical protein
MIPRVWRGVKVVLCDEQGNRIWAGSEVKSRSGERVFGGS